MKGVTLQPVNTLMSSLFVQNNFYPATNMYKDLSNKLQYHWESTNKLSKWLANTNSWLYKQDMTVSALYAFF
jgi:hypothetical protein